MERKRQARDPEEADELIRGRADQDEEQGTDYEGRGGEYSNGRKE
jgi:hypothetical protein